MTDASDIIAGLDGSPYSGMCRCPAHDDKTPSLKVSTGSSGKAVVYCHAGCSQESVIAALQAKGLWKQPERQRSKTPHGYYEDEAMADQQLSKPAADEDPYLSFRRAQWILSAAASAKPADHAERLAPYLTQRGISTPPPPSLMFLPVEQSRKLGRHIPGFLGYAAMVAPLVDQGHLKGAQVTFLNHDATTNLQSPKTGNIRRIYGKSGYIGLGVIDPERPPDTVVVGEGIETALSASQLTGCPALAVPGGNFIGITPPRAKQIIIAADNDASGTGMAKAEKAATLWAANGRAVSIAAPPHHKDWNDAARSDADPETLRELILHGTHVEPGLTDVGAVSAMEFLAVSFPPRVYLLEPWLTTGGLAMLHAKRGTGKTWLGLATGYAIVTGEELLGWKVHKTARVLYVDGELSGDELQKRLNAFGPCPANLFILSRHYLHVHKQELPDLGTPEGRAFLDKIITQNQIDVIILDSISTLVHSGVENDAESWAPIAKWQMDHRHDGRSIVYLHHEGRVGGNPRGTSKRDDPLDSMIRLEECPDQSSDVETAFKLSFTKKRGFFGSDAAPKIIYLSIRNGLVQWRHEAAKPDKREQVRDLLQAGKSQSEIATALHISKGYVSKVARDTPERRDSGLMGLP